MIDEQSCHRNRTHSLSNETQNMKTFIKQPQHYAQNMSLV